MKDPNEKLFLLYTCGINCGDKSQGLLGDLKAMRIFQPKYAKDPKHIRRSTKEHLRHFAHQILIVEEICMKFSEDGYLRKPTQWVRSATSLKSQVSDALKEQKTSKHPSFKNKDLERLCDEIFNYMKECPVEDVNDKPLAFIARLHETDDGNSQSDDVEKEWISSDTSVSSPAGLKEVKNCVTTGSGSEPILSPDSYGKLNMSAITGEGESSHAYDASKIEDENKSKVIGEGDAPSAERTNISSSYSGESKQHGKGVTAGPRQGDEFFVSPVDESRIIPIPVTGVMSKHVDLRLEILSVPSPQVTSSLNRHFGLNPEEDKYLLSVMKRHETSDINGASTSEYLVVNRSGSKSKEMPTADEWRQASVVNLSDKTLPLPCEEPDCPELELLFLQRNGCLTSIPSTFFEKMPALCFLDLSDTRIEALPSSLFKLSKLRVLLLRSCACLDSLPGDVKNLKSMQVLDLLGTDLDLPTEMDELGELWHLQLSYKPKFEDESQQWVVSDAISKLNNLQTLSIEVHSKDHNYWIKDVENMIQHVGKLTMLSYLQFYFPNVECLKSFIHAGLWKDRRLRRFNFIVGLNIKRIISRVPDEVESKFEQHDRCLRFINGDEVPESMKILLKPATAFYLDHHLTIESLSEFNISNFKELKFCVVRECPKIEIIIAGEGKTESALPNLECLELHYLWKLKQIWADPIPQGSFKSLKYMKVSTCGQLEYIASPSILQCLSNLNTFIIEDCESLRSIVKENETVNYEAPLLPRLKTLELRHLPKLVALGNGLFPSEQIISRHYCPNLILGGQTTVGCVEEILKTSRLQEAVVGATVDVLLQNLIAFSVEEIGLIWNLKKDLQNLKDSVATIRDFLEDAEMKQVNDKPVQLWLMKLEDLAFDADYVFDQLNYQLLRKKVHRGSKKKVTSFFSTYNPMAFRHRMARKIKNIQDELKSINQKALELGLQARMASAPARGAGAEAQAYLETDSFSMDPVFVGRGNDVVKILEMVTSNSSAEQLVSVLPIVGMGGSGKTTLTRKVYNDPIIVSHFGKRIWVHVSENNFDPVNVLKSVVASSTGENVDGSREVVLQKLRNSLGDKKYLLVLDNVWNESNEKWDNFITSLKGISSAKGNVIIVTSRSGNVATIVKTVDIHKLEVLSEDDCWFIIKAEAFGGEDIPSEFEIIGQNIAKQCGGLPLAAQVVGSFLRGKSKDEWASIEKNWLQSFGGDGNIVSKILNLSFDNLSLPSLKKCFALCSIFPKGWWMEKADLIDLWMAEGYLQTDDEEKDMEIVGNRAFNLLIQSSLLKVSERDLYGNVKYCAMHDLVHDLASSVLNPKFLDSTHKVRHISRLFMDESAPILEEHARGLRTLFFGGKVSHIAFSDFKFLHTLILGDEDINELPIEIGKLICLRCLDISNTRIECLPDSIGDLYHLQTLRATKVYGGPSYLVKLPDTLKFLISLRHLYIPNIKLPPDTGKLISLQTLPYFQVGDEEGRGIMELGSLKKLKGDLEIHNLEKVGDKEEAKTAKLFHKPNIFRLKFVWNQSEESEINDENVLEGLQPHLNLKCLEINGFRSRSFPLWTSQMAVRADLESHWVRLDNLIEIKLLDCKECEEIPMLGHLPRLKFLSLHGLTSVKTLGYSFYGFERNGVHKEPVSVFSALERLELIEMGNLTAWEEVELPSSSETNPPQVSVFGCLEQLKMIGCRQLMSAPSHFPCLKELEIDNMESSLPLANICGSKLTTLTKLKIQRVDELVCLPHRLFDCNGGLLQLSINKCDKLSHLVPSFGVGGGSLRELELRNCLNFMEFPYDLHNLNALTELNVLFCPNLKSVPYPSGGSKGFASLRRLGFFDCTDLTYFPCELLESCVPSLEELNLTGSESLTNLPQVLTIAQRMARLTALGIGRVPKFNDAAAEIGSLYSLQNLRIGGSKDCPDYVSFKESLDRCSTVLRSIRVLALDGMQHWDALPDHLQHLTALQWLNFNNFGIEVLPEWLENLSSLKTLYLIDCLKLRRLPSKKAMEGLTKLVVLEIFNCPALEHSLLQQTSNDSEWSKISHIPDVKVDGLPIQGLQAQ